VRFCAENWPKWWQIFPALDRAAVRPVGVDVSSGVTRDFIAQHQMTDMPVVAQADPKALVRYQFRLNPDDSGRCWGKVEKCGQVFWMNRMWRKSSAWRQGKIIYSNEKNIYPAFLFKERTQLHGQETAFCNHSRNGVVCWRRDFETVINHVQSNRFLRQRYLHGCQPRRLW